MQKENLKWKIGDVEIFQLVEMVDNELFSTFIPEARPEAVLKIEWLKKHFIGEKGNLKAQVQSFMIKSSGKYILVDTCNGNHKDRPGMPTWGKLNTRFLDKFKNIDISPDKIDFVVCTHLHFDHVGWNTTLENGKWVPTFKNAQYLFSQDEYNYWVKKPEKEVIDDFNGFDDSVSPIVDAGLVKFISDDYRLDSNIRFIPTPGHTPHHISVVIESKGKKAIISGDVMHHPCQIAQIKWTTLADTYPEQTIETRTKFLKEYANTDTLIIGTHFPYPVAGYITEENNNYKFVNKNHVFNKS